MKGTPLKMPNYCLPEADAKGEANRTISVLEKSQTR